MNYELISYLLDWAPSLVVFLIGFVSVFLTGKRFSRLDSSIRCLSLSAEPASAESAFAESAPAESVPVEPAPAESVPVEPAFNVFSSFSDDELLRYYHGNSLILHDLVDELIKRGLLDGRK